MTLFLIVAALGALIFGAGYVAGWTRRTNEIVRADDE
jgi:hypothetical protein